MTCKPYFLWPRLSCCAWLALAIAAPTVVADNLPERATTRPNLVSDPAALKAAFLYNFALFTAWPAPSPAVITLCAVGRDELGSAFDALANKQIDGKPVQVRRIESATEAKACQVVFVPESSSAALASIARGLQTQPVLVVTEVAAADTSMIVLETEGSRLAFSVNLVRVKAAGLELSSKLLRLARSVK